MTTPPVPAGSGDLPQGDSILVVDDEAMVRRIATLALSAAGYHVVEAETAAAAIAVTRSAQMTSGLVLLDLTLPDGDGTTIIPVIRQETPRTRILIVSGQGELDASSIGADGFLSKPYTRSALLAAVRGALNSL